MSFLKVKRKCEEDPREILVLARKKHKLLNTSDHVPIFELASSAVKEQDLNDEIVKTIKNYDIKSPKCNLEKLRTRIREDIRERQNNDRYQLHAALRKLDDTTLEQETVPMIDVLDDGAIENENRSECVYDLYYSNTSVDVTDPDFHENHILHEITEEYSCDWEFESEDDEEVLDDDDSNDEDNWRNEYPDREGSGEDSDDPLWEKMGKVRISSDHSRSSSDDDECYYYEGDDYYDEVTDGSISNTED